MIATPENYHAEITAELEKRGFSSYICIDSKKEAALMERYYKSTGKFRTLHALKKGSERPEAAVYMSKFVGGQTAQPLLGYAGLGTPDPGGRGHLPKKELRRSQMIRETTFLQKM